MKIKDLTKISVVAALYVAISLTIAPASYGMIQLRIADIFCLLCLYDKKYIYSNIIGVFLVNLFSPLGIVDVIVGTLVTAICGFTSYLIKNKWLYSVICSVIIGFGIGTELYYVFGGSYWINVASIIVSTIIVLAVGCTLQSAFKAIAKGVNKNV